MTGENSEKIAKQECPACHCHEFVWLREFPRNDTQMIDVYECCKCSTQHMETRAASRQEVIAWFNAK